MAVSRIAFWAGYPAVLIGFWRLKRRCEQRHFPTRWCTLNRRMVDELTKDPAIAKRLMRLEEIDALAERRDKLLASNWSRTVLVVGIMVYLYAHYRGMELDANFFGFTVRYSAAIGESLLLVANVIAFSSLVVSKNASQLEAMIRYGLTRSLPPDLYQAMQARYFADSNWGFFVPVSQRIVPKRSTLALYAGTAIGTLLLGAIGYALFLVANVQITLAIVLHPQQGSFSYVIGGLVIGITVCSALYTVCAFFPLPYKDFATNDVVRKLQERNPRAYAQKLDEVYGQVHRERLRLKALGYRVW